MSDIEYVTIECLIGEIRLTKEDAMEIKLFKELFEDSNEKDKRVKLQFTLSTVMSTLEHFLFNQEIILDDMIINCSDYLLIDLQIINDIIKYMDGKLIYYEPLNNDEYINKRIKNKQVLNNYVFQREFSRYKEEVRLRNEKIRLQNEELKLRISKRIFNSHSQ